jgi:iron complex transport system substrate-binding protein
LRRLGAKVGAPVVEIDAANSFADIRRVTRQIGTLVGEPDRAEALIADMDRTLAELAATRPRRTVRVVAWSGAGSVPGKGTLTDELIRTAGGENIAVKYDDGRYSSFGMEELLRARPDALLHGADRYDGPSLRDAAITHSVIRKAFRGRQISYPASLYTCGLPQSAEAARNLREALGRLPAGGVSW